MNCSQLTWERLWGHCDVFAFSHFFGWALKALLVRNAPLLWTSSIMWEVTEVSCRMLDKITREKKKRVKKDMSYHKN